MRSRNQNGAPLISQNAAEALSLLPPKSVHQYTSYEGEVVTVKGVLGSMWKLTKNRRFMYLIPQFAWTGISIAYYSGILVVMMQEAIGGTDIQYQFKMSMLALVLFGVGEIVGCFFIGMVVDKFGSKIATVVNLLNITAMIGVTIAFIIQFEFNYLAWIMCFLWGVCDSAVNTNTQELIGFEFDNNSEPFSVFNTIQCIANLTCQLIISTLHGQKAYFILTVACGAVAFLSCGLVFYFPYREIKSNKSAAAQSE
jgi:MFS family permease